MDKVHIAKRAMVIALVLSCFSARSVYTEDGHDTILLKVPDCYRSRVAESLRLAGSNAGELVSILNQTSNDEIEEASFLIANMPYRDLGSMRADIFLENLRYANESRRELPWGDQIPDHIFRHYVLPYRVTQERLVSWRPIYHTELLNVVRPCTTMTQAAIQVNRWLDERLNFESTERRDQDPVTTLKRGIGRCEELTIAFVAAARSVCLPARSCWTPWWALSDNNHAWAEVWADGDWHYTGAAEASEHLDEAWFSKPAEHAAAVYSSCFGRMESASEPIYRQEDRYTIINSTGVYAEPRTLTVHIMADSGSSCVNAKIWAHVFNYGWFMPVASKSANSSGIATFVLGPGDYLLSGGDDSMGFVETVSLLHTDNYSDTLEVVCGSVTGPDGFRWLRYIQ